MGQHMNDSESRLEAEPFTVQALSFFWSTTPYSSLGNISLQRLMQPRELFRGFLLTGAAERCILEN